MSIHRLAAMGDAHRSASEWRAQLRAARNENEVLGVVRAFLASLTPFEWTLLEVPAEVANVESATDLAALSYELVRLQHARRDTADALISAMTAVLSDAVTRVAQLGNPRNAETA